MNWMINLLRRRQMSRDVADEIEAHIEEKAAGLMDSGIPEREAREWARREFGNTARVSENSRAVWGWTWLDRLAQDLRYAFRMLHHAPGFTAVAVLSLALGIGANTAIFGLLDIILFRMLPVQRPEELLMVGVAGRSQKGLIARPSLSHTYALFGKMRDENHSFQAIAGLSDFTWKDKSVVSNNAWHAGQMISGNYFDVLGVGAVTGRTLAASDDAVEGTGRSDGIVAMLSYNYWRREFHGDPAVAGRQINVNGAWVTIVGVTPPEFFGTQVGSSPDVFIPIQAQPAVMPPGNLLHDRPNGSTTWVTVLGRLRPGIHQANAKADLTRISEQYEFTRMSPGDQQEYLKKKKPLNANIVFEPGGRGLSRLRERFSEPLKVVMVLVGIVLLIACANIANLLLARANARRKEIGVRLAIGAGRGRIIRQLLTESLLLAGIGGALGLLFAIWSSALLVRMLPQGQVPVTVAVTPDLRVLGFALGLSILTGLLFGVAPAFRSTRISVNNALKQGRDSAGRLPRFDLGKALAVSELALAVPLLVGAGLFIGTLRNLVEQDAGFMPRNVLQMQVNLDVAGYPQAQWRAIYNQIVEKVTAVPGVQSASVAKRGLMEEGRTSSGPVHFPGYTFQTNESRDLPETYVGAEYFGASGIPLRLGRFFTSKDDTGAPQVAIVNETLVQRYFNGQNPIGKRFGIGDTPAGTEIVGVVADAKYNNLRQEPIPMAYYPWQQMGPQRLNSVIVRTQGNPALLARALRESVASIHPELVQQVRTLSSQIDDSLVRERMLARLSGFFGLVAMLLACIGLYGVMAFGVTRRTSEIGVRVALGATPADVIWMVLRQTLALTAAGITLGVPLALGLSRLTGAFLYGLKPNDPLLLATAVLALTAVGAIAATFPRAVPHAWIRW